MEAWAHRRILTDNLVHFQGVNRLTTPLKLQVSNASFFYRNGSTNQDAKRHSAPVQRPWVTNEDAQAASRPSLDTKRVSRWHLRDTVSTTKHPSLLLHSGSQLLTGSGTKQAYLSARLGQTTPPYSILRKGAAFPEPNLNSSRDLIQAGRGAREAAHKTFSVIKRTPLSRGTYGLIIVGTTQLSPLERSWGSLTVQCYHLWASP